MPPFNPGTRAALVFVNHFDPIPVNVLRSDAGVRIPTAHAGGTELGVNVIGGLKLGRGHGAPFLQARYEVGGGKQLVVTGGIEF